MFRLSLYLFCLLGFWPLAHAAVILQYHHVSEDTPASTSIAPALFKEHLAYLEEQDFTIWPLPKLIEHLKAKESIPDKVVVITFDDAYDSIYKTAFPLLKARKWPFTVFVAPQPIEQKLASFMSWAQLLEMQLSGATIANHSFAHEHLVRRRDQESKDAWLSRISVDIQKAQTLLSRNLGDIPKLLAYPYGEFTETLAEHIESLGFVAFGQQSGAVSSLHALTQLPRFPMTNFFGEMSQFKTKVASLPFPAQTVKPAIQVIETDKQAPASLQLKLFPQAVREQQLSCFFAGEGRLETQISRTDSAIVADIGQLPTLPVGRSRINCTAPSSLKEFNGRFHWFSHFWMRKKQDGSWYEEE